MPAKFSNIFRKYETPTAAARDLLLLILMGYGNAAALLAWRGACLGQKARHPLSEGARCARKQAKEKEKLKPVGFNANRGKCGRREHLLGRNLRVRQQVHVPI